MEIKRNQILEALRARAKEARERAIAEGRTIPSVEHKNAFIERLKARAEAQGKTFNPKPMTNERMQKIIERIKNRQNKINNE